MIEENKSVLIITYFMAPYSPNWGNCQRMFFLADYLYKKNVDVKVICAQTGIKKDFGKDINFDVIPIDLFKTDNSSFQNISGDEENDSSFIFKIKMTFRYFISDVYKFISGEPMPHIARRGNAFVKNGTEVFFDTIEKNKIKNVIISGPPFSIFSTTNKIKQKFDNVNVILDYRDPWFLWKKNSPFNYFVERKYLKQADKIVTFSEEFKEDLIKKFKIPSHKCYNIFNGYSESAWNSYEKTKLSNDKMVISHVGTISFGNGGYRDPNPFIEALSNFKYKNDIHVRFVGVTLNDNTKKIKNEYGDNIEFIERVSHEESLNYMANSDILLLIHSSKDSSSKYIISAKFFDYLKSDRFVFEIGEKNGLHRKLIKKFNNGISSLNNTDDIQKKIMDVYEKWKNNKIQVLKNIDINEYSREFQNENYIKLIN